MYLELLTYVYVCAVYMHVSIQKRIVKIPRASEIFYAE